MPVRSAIIMALLCLSCLTAVPALAENGYNPGFRTLGFWQQESGIRVDVNVWYPSVRAPRSLSYAPWTIRGARNGKPVPGRFPLILLSHPSSGTRFSFHDTAAALAARGFVVAAPTHPRDCMANMDHLFLWEQLKNRALELSATMDLLLADKDIGPSIDPKRIGVLGYGSGATAALLLGGALPDCSGWMDYCRKAPLDDAYCYEQPRARMDSMCAHFPLDPRSLTDPRVKAIAAVGPVFGRLFSSQGLAGLHPHLLLVSLEHDDLSIPSLHADALYERMGRKPAHLFLDKADMSLLMAPCPPSLANELPEMCHDELDPLRQQLFSTLTRRLAAFFLEWLGTQEATEGFFSLGTGE